MVSAHTIVGTVGNVISCSLFLSPIPTFYGIYKKGAVEDFSPNPYIFTVLNCALWVYTKQRLVAVKESLVCFVFYALVVLSCSLSPNSKSWRGKFIGGICDNVNVPMYAVPCDKLYQVYKTECRVHATSALAFGFSQYNGVGCVFSIIQLSVYAYYYFKYPQSKNNKIVDEMADESKVKLS
ncbi:hypothetical protein MKX01_003920 [Papaver californicum]|nr:hypothetical protein MKX01_003920 [Papaver californicum]